MGKYSIALEKAKTEKVRHSEPLDELTDQEEAVMQEDGPDNNLHSPPSEKISTSGSEGIDINSEVESWNDKLKEIVTGNSTQVLESIRMLRTKIFYPDSGEPPRSILVTSAIPGEGKSFVCANLGISIALGIEKEALLVECDMRRPSLTKFLGLENTRGLVDFLQSGTPIEQLVQKTSMPKLSLLSSGKPPKNPAELVESQKMASLIETLTKQNPDRVIIFDSPPIQAASETDVLAKRVDKVILVVRSGYARREHTKQLVELIGRDKILGVVFNAFEMSRLESKLQGYYYGYKDYYSSSYSKYYENQPTKGASKRKSSVD